MVPAVGADGESGLRTTAVSLWNLESSAPLREPVLCIVGIQAFDVCKTSPQTTLGRLHWEGESL